MEFSFQKEYPLEERIKLCQKLKEEYSGKIPIILEKDKNSKVDEIKKKKFLESEKFTLNEFLLRIKSKVTLPMYESLFFHIKGKTLESSKTLGEIYKLYKDSDGFLYIVYSSELVFG